MCPLPPNPLPPNWPFAPYYAKVIINGFAQHLTPLWSISAMKKIYANNCSPRKKGNTTRFEAP